MLSVQRTLAQALALTTTLLAATYSLADPEDPHADWESIEPGVADDRIDWHVLKQLDVNLETTHRLVVRDLCESEGERELVRLSASATTEEAFVFVPSLCLWIEVGLAESGKSVRVDHSFIERLIGDHPKLVLYHIHPGSLAEAVDFFPAYSDLIGVLLMNGPFLDEPSVDIRHRAISAIGVIDYEFHLTEDTARLVQKMTETGLGGAIGQNLAYSYAAAEHQESYYGALRNCSLKVDGREERLDECFPMSSRDFVLNFRRYETVNGGVKDR